MSIETNNNIIYQVILLGVVVISYIGIMGLIQKKIYNGKNALQINQILNTKTDLSDELVDKVVNQLSAIMGTKKPFLNNKLNLSELAELMSISPDILSQVIKKQFNLSFYQYINSFRTETTK